MIKTLLFSPFVSLRFHVVASKGNLDCLNALLVHGIDIVATDIAGMISLFKIEQLHVVTYIALKGLLMQW